ncbi:MAG: hypothetical protein ACSHW7_09955 [Patiriisocius sp.]|uniref:hypothetical protein n=1 Tax=Patiriisocius sp. TaxID=2822396 RepID=UPI003EFB2807
MFDDEDEERPKNHEDIEKMPIYVKAMEIYEIVRSIIEAVENTDIDFDRENAEFQSDWIERSLHYLMENALVLPAKIAGAEGGDIYDIRMENAAIIRKSAMELITDARALEINGYEETEYLNLLRTEIDNFRILFAEWVKTFDVKNYYIDRWGLFNPPGVNYDDHDPDDDIPFDPDEFLDFLMDDLDEDNNEEEDDDNSPF